MPAWEKKQQKSQQYAISKDALKGLTNPRLLICPVGFDFFLLKSMADSDFWLRLHYDIVGSDRISCSEHFSDDLVH